MKTRSGMVDSDITNTQAPQNLLNNDLKQLIQSVVKEETSELLKIISELRSEVVILRESNIELINLLTNNNPCLSSHKQPEKPVEANIPSLNNYAKISNQNKDKVSVNTSKKVCDKEKANNLEKPVDTIKSKNLNRYKKTNTKTIIGTNKYTNERLSGVEKKAWLHLSKFRNNNVEVNDVIELIRKDVDVDSVICEKYKTFHGDHTYFKLGIPNHSLNKIYKPDYWPTGVEVSQFLFRSKRKDGPSNADQRLQSPTK